VPAWDPDQPHTWFSGRHFFLHFVGIGVVTAIVAPIFIQNILLLLLLLGMAALGPVGWAVILLALVVLGKDLSDAAPWMGGTVLAYTLASSLALWSIRRRLPPLERVLAVHVLGAGMAGLALVIHLLDVT